MIRTATLTAILSSLLIAAGFEFADACTLHVTFIDDPAFFETVISDINNAGQALGTYDRRHGFVYGDGSFASLDFGRAFMLDPIAINDLDFPSSRRRPRSRQLMIFPLGINNEGTVVGMEVNPRNLKTRPFIYEDGAFRSIGPFRKGLNYIGGINDEGHMAGRSSKLGGYLYDGSSFVPIPSEFPLFPMDLNISDQVVGFYFGNDRKAHGFFFDDGRLHTIDYPGATSTFLTGINDAGEMTGWYRQGRAIDCFVTSPVPLPGTVWLLAAGLLGLALTSQSLLPSFRPRRLLMQK